MDTDTPFTITYPKVEQVRADRVCAADKVWFPSVFVEADGWEYGPVRSIEYIGDDVEIVFINQRGRRVEFGTSRNNPVWVTKRD